MLERSVAQLMEEHGREYQLLHDAQTSIESIDRQIQDHIGQPSDPMSSDLEIPRHRARIKVLDERIAATNVGSKSLGRKIEQAIIYEQQCRGYQDQIAQLEARRAQLAIRLYQPGFIEIEETGSEATPVTTPPNGLKILFGCIIGAFAGGAGFVLIKLA